jgi:hypothetical protein
MLAAATVPLSLRVRAGFVPVSLLLFWSYRVRRSGNILRSKQIHREMVMRWLFIAAFQKVRLNGSPFYYRAVRCRHHFIGRRTLVAGRQTRLTRFLCNG